MYDVNVFTPSLYTDWRKPVVKNETWCEPLKTDRRVETKRKQKKMHDRRMPVSFAVFLVCSLLYRVRENRTDDISGPVANAPSASVSRGENGPRPIGTFSNHAARCNTHARRPDCSVYTLAASRWEISVAMNENCPWTRMNYPTTYISISSLKIIKQCFDSIDRKSTYTICVVTGEVTRNTWFMGDSLNQRVAMSRHFCRSTGDQQRDRIWPGKIATQQNNMKWNK